MSASRCASLQGLGLEHGEAQRGVAPAIRSAARLRRRRGGHFEAQAEALEQRFPVARTGREHESPRLSHHFVLTGLLRDDIIRRPMSHEPAHQPVIDGFEFASAGATQARGLAAERFAAPARHARDGRGRSAPTRSTACATSAGVRRCGCRCSGTLELRCQRCLEPMPFEVQTDETAGARGDAGRDPRRAGRRARARPRGRRARRWRCAS